MYVYTCRVYIYIYSPDKEGDIGWAKCLVFADIRIIIHYIHCRSYAYYIYHIRGIRGIRGI